MFTLDLGIAVKQSTQITFEICDEIEESLGLSRDSSGCGFGIRDMQFRFNTKKEADEAEVKVKEIFKKHNIEIGDSELSSYISIYNEEENECSQ